MIEPFNLTSTVRICASGPGNTSTVLHIDQFPHRVSVDKTNTISLTSRARFSLPHLFLGLKDEGHSLKHLPKLVKNFLDISSPNSGIVWLVIHGFWCKLTSNLVEQEMLGCQRFWIICI